jgi:sugar/nucleoside kinase (ribokinase family)
MPPVDYLVIGHVAKDIVPAGGSSAPSARAFARGSGAAAAAEGIDFRTAVPAAGSRAPAGHAIGGTVTYSAVTAQRLGLSAAIVTAMDAAFASEVQAALPAIGIHTRPSPQTTTFENIYTDVGRSQFLRAHAERLTCDDVPAAWRGARIVHLGPIAQEFDAEMAAGFGGSLLALTPQGWLRQWDAAGRVRPRKWEQALEVLPAIDVLIFSPEDVGHDWEVIHAYTRAARLAVLTLERHGALVFERNEGRWQPPREAQVLDPTGAGDVFAAAFLTAYHESGNPLLAARFANVAASFSIEKGGISAIPTRAIVDEWMDSHPRFFE